MKNKKIKFLFSFCIVILIFTFFILNYSYAQQVSLSLSPPLIELLAKPGKSVLIAYTLENLGDPVILSTKVLPFIPLDNQGKIQIKPDFEGPIRFSLENSNLNLGQSFFLRNKQSQQLLLRIRVPEGAPEGDYYYSFLVESQPSLGALNESSSFSKATIGGNILITVSESGQTNIKGKINLFDVVPRYQIKIFGKSVKIFESSDLIPVVLILENNGKNFIKPQGEIILTGNFGEKAKYNVLSQNILSQSQRLIQASPSAEINCQNENKKKICSRPFSLVISGFFIGKYRLSTAVNFGEGTPNLFAQTTFYALPIKLSIGFLISILMVIIIAKRLKNQLN